jgi:putative zinc finger/helix-turn-helix YgiT family protein
MSVPIEQQRCAVCGERSLRREKRLYEYAVSHDGRPPVTVRIPDLDVIVCTNSNCHPEHPDDTMILDDAASWRITEETYRQLGLLTPTEIRESREQLGLNQQELQQMLGLGGNSLSRWENGHVYQARSMDMLLRIIFNVPEARGYVEATERSRGSATRTSASPVVRQQGE